MIEALRPSKSHLLWALPFAVVLAGRATLDAFVPTHEFAVRGMLTTYAALTIFLAAGFSSTWTTSSLRAAAVRGLIAAATACLVVYVVNAALLGGIAMAGNDRAWAAIQSSGGPMELFTLPAIAIVPATVIATLGGATALLVDRLAPFRARLQP